MPTHQLDKRLSEGIKKDQYYQDHAFQQLKFLHHPNRILNNKHAWVT